MRHLNSTLQGNEDAHDEPEKQHDDHQVDGEDDDADDGLVANVVCAMGQ